MQTIQLVISDSAYANKLKQSLLGNGNWTIEMRDFPSFEKDAVVVFDTEVLANLTSPPDYPDRVVLVTRNDPTILARAWDLGIRSVVYQTDTPNTVILAIMSAYLRLPKPENPQQGVITPTGPNSLLKIYPQSRSTRRG